ncbi:MAG: branched-chain amino acid ABC transporter permease [Candidatus Dormibacteraceae bacterium]
MGTFRGAAGTLRQAYLTRVLGALVMAIVAYAIVPGIIHAGPTFFFRILVIGIATGAIYALIALGYTMVYGIIELINFAHGDVFTLGAFISLPVLAAFNLKEGVPLGVRGVMLLLATFAIVMLIDGVINLVIEKVAYRPLRNAPRLAPLITAVGMSFILEGIMFVWKGPFNLHYPNLLPDSPVSAGFFRASSKDLIVVAVAVVLVAALAIFINVSKLGKAMRATAQDRDAARLMGINIDRVISATFFIGAALAAAGGIIYGLYVNSVNNTLGFNAGLVAFTAAVFGGIGNIPGAALGGLAIGLIRAFSDGYGQTTWTDPVTFAVLIMVLVFRPSGLLGMRVPEK